MGGLINSLNEGAVRAMALSLVYSSLDRSGCVEVRRGSQRSVLLERSRRLIVTRHGKLPATQEDALSLILSEVSSSLVAQEVGEKVPFLLLKESPWLGSDERIGFNLKRSVVSKAN